MNILMKADALNLFMIKKSTHFCTNGAILLYQYTGFKELLMAQVPKQVNIN